jgi:hypothetical protein
MRYITYVLSLRFRWVSNFCVCVCTMVPYASIAKKGSPAARAKRHNHGQTQQSVSRLTHSCIHDYYVTPPPPPPDQHHTSSRVSIK